LIISIIVAIDENGGIGKGNQLPWHLPSDLKRFKSLTMGHHLIMGRKTYESIGKPLQGRQMIVVTHSLSYQPEGCITVNSIEDAIRVAKRNLDTEAFIIGGGHIFSQSINMADKIYLTKIHTISTADVFFPKINPDTWKIVSCEKDLQNEKDEYPSDFIILLRK
jgi:dihydrofolate reductase